MCPIPNDYRVLERRSRGRDLGTCTRMCTRTIDGMPHLPLSWCESIHIQGGWWNPNRNPDEGSTISVVRARRSLAQKVSIFTFSMQSLIFASSLVHENFPHPEVKKPATQRGRNLQNSGKPTNQKNLPKSKRFRPRFKPLGFFLPALHYHTQGIQPI